MKPQRLGKVQVEVPITLPHRPHARWQILCSELPRHQKVRDDGDLGGSLSDAELDSRLEGRLAVIQEAGLDEIAGRRSHPVGQVEQILLRPAQDAAMTEKDDCVHASGL